MVRRLVGVGALVVVFAVAVLAAPVHAYAQQPAPGETEPDPPAVPDVDDADEEVVDWSDPSDDGDSLAPGGGDDPADTDGRDDGDRPEAADEVAPNWDALERLLDELPSAISPIVSREVARPRGERRRAAIPRGTPKRVRRLIWHLNSIVGKRFRPGAGHGKLVDRSNACSGALSYGLIKAGLLRSSMLSARFARWGAAGAGHWVTIYANKRHVYMEVAGRRLDTNPVGDDPDRKGLRWRPVIGKRHGFTVRHPAGL